MQPIPQSPLPDPCEIVNTFYDRYKSDELMSVSPSHPAADLQDRLAALSIERLRGMRRGVEKESLRATPSGMLALTPHPAALGSPLTHPHITTDFSESQVELVTGAHQQVQAVLD